MADPVTETAEATGRAAKGSANAAGAFLKGKMFGMPRWTWFGLLAGGIVLGLYLRTRAADDEAAMMDEDSAEAGFGYPGDDTLLGYADDPDFAGVGIAGPPGGSVIPVSSPFLPEGMTDIFGNFSDLTTALIENLPAAWNNTPDPPTAPPPTGGGPPGRGQNNHRPRVRLDGSELDRAIRGLEPKERKRLNQISRPGPGDSTVIGRNRWQKFLKSLSPAERKALRKAKQNKPAAA